MITAPFGILTDVSVCNVYCFIPGTVYEVFIITFWHPVSDDSNDSDDGAVIDIRLLHPATILVPIDTMLDGIDNDVSPVLAKDSGPI